MLPLVNFDINFKFKILKKYLKRTFIIKVDVKDKKVLYFYDSKTEKEEVDDLLKNN